MTVSRYSRMMDDAGLVILLEEVKNDFRAAGIEPGRIRSVSFSGRLTRSRGNCRRESDGLYSIHISSRLKGHTDLLRETLAHELLHTVAGCFDHGHEFQKLAVRLEACGYHIQRTYEPEAFEMEGRYRFRCSKCGVTVTRTRRSSFTEFPERYIHKGCGGHFEPLPVHPEKGKRQTAVPAQKPHESDG